jgi:hypothetical protein
VLEQGIEDGSLLESYRLWLGDQLDPAPPPAPRYRD